LSLLAKELFDRVVALVGLLLLTPLLLPMLFLVWRQDGHSPFYVADRAARSGGRFRMVKIRSMIVAADRTGVASTAGDDARITPLGQFIRRWKIDELSQLWNVLKGDMSLVGPRPQVLDEVATYAPDEMRLLDVKPGITDFASIIFADEGEILRGKPDPDLAYRQLIRPWKSRLGLHYVAHRSFAVDLRLIQLTLVRIVAPDRALAGVCRLLESLGASDDLLRIARRKSPLEPQEVTEREKPFDA
jgi:lipopolysaccharide/colanic/teichoic acid biosynthesis glycosyltransferase